jgi:hypothetical protein
MSMSMSEMTGRHGRRTLCVGPLGRVAETAIALRVTEFIARRSPDNAQCLRQTLRSDAAINAAAERAVAGFLRSGTAAVGELPRYGSVIEVTGGTGFGARWTQQTGEFIGFINP